MDELTPCQEATVNELEAKRSGLPYEGPVPDDWFIDRTNFFDLHQPAEHARLLARKAHAIHLCHYECPLRVQCLTEGLKSKNLPYGVFGGYTAEQRHEIVEARRKHIRRHGTAPTANPFD